MFLAAIIPYVLDLFNLVTYPPELDGAMMQISKETLLERLKITVRDFSSMFTDREAIRSVANSAAFSALFKTTKDYLQPILESFALSLPVFIGCWDAFGCWFGDLVESYSFIDHHLLRILCLT
jgi:hypothetical protein